MSSTKDEVSRRAAARRDPRVDPDSVRGGRKESSAAGVREEVAPRAKKRDPRAESDSLPAMRAVRPEDIAAAAQAEAEGSEERASTPDAEPSSARDGASGGEPEAKEGASEERASTPDAEPASARDQDEAGGAAEERGSRPEAEPAPKADPRLVEVDRLIDRTAWKEIVEKLGPPEKAGELPPSLALVYALARREAAGDEAARGATELAIKSMAALLGVGADSAAALVLAKRLLRQNPVSWRTRPAPPAKLSVAIVVIGVALGVLAGSFLSLSAFQSVFKSLKLF